MKKLSYLNAPFGIWLKPWMAHLCWGMARRMLLFPVQLTVIDEKHDEDQDNN